MHMRMRIRVLYVYTVHYTHLLRLQRSSPLTYNNGSGPSSAIRRFPMVQKDGKGTFPATCE